MTAKNLMETPAMLSASYGDILSGVNNCIVNTPASWKPANWPEPTVWDTTVLDSLNKQPNKIKEKVVDMRRLVRVIIVDPNENVPVDKAILYMGGEEVTDLTDTELFYELEIKALLKQHNEYRVTVKDKKASKSKDKDEFLEEVRIKDLKMVVLTIATF
jgi:hypothetical protein